MMKTLPIRELTPQAFQDYGTFGSLTPPAARPLMAGETISFWPDCGGVLDLGPSGANRVSVGVCQVRWRPLQIDVAEFHTSTGEGILPLDGDVAIHVGPPTGADEAPVEDFEVFLVPKGTMVVLKPGVWHHAPFAMQDGQTVNTVILLPQRTYANDCIVRAVDPPVPFR